MRIYFTLFCFYFLFGPLLAQEDITTPELKGHIAYLTADKSSGRYPGGKVNKRIVRYIAKDFKKSGISPFLKSYKQPFMAHLRVKKGEEPKSAVETWNVIGFIEGNDPLLKNEYILLGAHYDHLGMGGGPSSKSDKIGIHHGADDNASGTSALLEIGEMLMAHKTELKRSILLVAFGAEEQGLLGSKYFTDHPVVPLSKIKLMINMDMVGRLNDAKQVYMGGAGTFPGGVELMKELGPPLGLSPVVHAGSVGGSDHVSFYKKNISVLGIHTGGHPQYHTPEDTMDLINFDGQKQVCQYIFNTIMKVASTSYEMKFIPQGE
ncbi:M20/M25/M40 family metallo-hydrolase [Arenibacter sp. M-2]|uniref:M28 family metallopeptidase n=1 Tax=Arenibacter sp. M-2 TaxID=3053612 RepID=UPI0025708C75|nr:M20/M25/M40 family metallo-hydrolase [Arenibacter sp. M-2]MDL5512351.1 M20/M25/M40 family metallo-hydrolase [Arenibacter sp. M-2]|tara:strand:+ start:56262 stop:57221 length:960 start_codon:yes stop_codon:yes gene_type:complete